MKKILLPLLCVAFISTGFCACSPSDDPVKDDPSTENPDNPGQPENPTPDPTPTPDPNPAPTPDPEPSAGKTLIAYYSYTNNVHTIVSDLSAQIEADVVRVEPAEKGLDYAANNYAIGSAQIQAIRNNPNEASSYPAIDPVNIDLKQYGTVIVAAPLWWSNMAAPMQSFLFKYGPEMAGKRIGLIVSSASSGISGVESDAKRLIPDGNFLTPSLWIRSSQTSGCHSLNTEWLAKTGIAPAS